MPSPCPAINHGSRFGDDPAEGQSIPFKPRRVHIRPPLRIAHLIAGKLVGSTTTSIVERSGG